MGTIKHGILGGFSKKTGTVIGANWRSLAVIRALPKTSKRNPTQEQMDQRIKFKLVTQFLADIDGLIATGFAEGGEVKTAMNRAVAYHIKNAITGDSPDFSIALEKVVFSKGTLETPDLMEGTTEAVQKVNVTWTNDGQDHKKKSPDDTLVLLAYHPEKKRFHRLITEVKRSNLAYELALPASYAGANVHIYAAFNSATSKFLSSDTVYIGSFLIQ